MYSNDCNEWEECEMVEMGMKKKDRQKKGMIDEVAATMMLQEFLANNEFR